MIISIIVAAAQNGAIGKDNTLLWHLPDDFKRFKRITMGKPILMGRKTFESIGKPLPGRLNIIVSRNPTFTAEGCQVVGSIEEGLTVAASTDTEEVFIIGGGVIYKEIMPQTDRIYLTKVHATPEADTYFEITNPENWTEVLREFHPADDKHQYAFEFIDLQKNK